MAVTLDRFITFFDEDVITTEGTRPLRRSLIFSLHSLFRLENDLVLRQGSSFLDA